MGFAVPGRPPQPISIHSTSSSYPDPTLDELQDSTERLINQECSALDTQLLETVKEVTATTSHTPVTCEENVPSPYFDMDVYPLQISHMQAKPLLRPSVLKDTCYILPGNEVFIDKVLPPIKGILRQNESFPIEYFVALHKLVAAQGATYPAYTPNYRGARIPPG